MADYLEERAEDLIKDKDVLELGAGAGLPSLVCAINGARTVVVTDYPDPELIENLRLNVSNCSLLPNSAQIHAEGLLWGSPIAADLSNLNPGSHSIFELLILADLLFNHSEHAKLVQSVQMSLKRSPEACALIFFTPYRPWLLEKDLAFFDKAREAGFDVEKIYERMMDKVMFEDDPGVSLSC